MKEYEVDVECCPHPSKELGKLIEEAAGVNAESGSGCSDYETWQFYYKTKQEQVDAAKRLQEVSSIDAVQHRRGVQISIRPLMRDQARSRKNFLSWTQEELISEIMRLQHVAQEGWCIDAVSKVEIETAAEARGVSNVDNT